MGSGAGFPGIVMSILGMPETHLIESTGKKADFLRVIINELGLNATIHQCRIENLRNHQFDVIAARALKSLPELMKLAKPLMKKESHGLFLKGKSLHDELTESARSWTFDYATSPSISDPSGTVLIIRSLQFKNDAPKFRKRKK
jgi:16S rRNA (guanine527-N7)-methyltransferase